MNKELVLKSTIGSGDLLYIAVTQEQYNDLLTIVESNEKRRANSRNYINKRKQEGNPVYTPKGLKPNSGRHQIRFTDTVSHTEQYQQELTVPKINLVITGQQIKA